MAPRARGPTVHPHVCGDDAPLVQVGADARGSPPRVWGRHHLPAHHQLAQRFTPTCVGTTSSSGVLMPPGTVHPHVCGDDNVRLGPAGGRFGSPPRVWGRLPRWRFAWRGARFTPTCVGTTQQPRRGRGAAPVHPHVCGDDTREAPPSFPTSGSPPRVWGRRRPVVIVVSVMRFTPTCVGTTRTAHPCHHLAAVHPHVCGDDSRAASCDLMASGSPPRVWGRQTLLRHLAWTTRFTPTCVGTTLVRVPRMSRRTVHPHVCGDDLGRRVAVIDVPGSPPRVWGRRCDWTMTAFRFGSPPRVWGRRTVMYVHCSTARFTPTCVGTTLLGCVPSCV